MTPDPRPGWWRGGDPATAGIDPWDGVPPLTGEVSARDVETAPILPGDGFRRVALLSARMTGGEVWLTDVLLRVAWSEIEEVRFRQRMAPVLVHDGTAAQGSFGNRPSVYRGCHFDRVRFKMLGGFSTGAARFEECTFTNCRWEGSLQGDSDFLGCTFVGRIRGALFFGDEVRFDRVSSRRNIIRDNDFTGAVLTNTAFRAAFPVADQRWPVGYVPLVDDLDA